MIRISRSPWRISLAAFSLAAAAAVGGTIAWAQTPTTAPAVSPNHAAAVDAFKKARDLFQQDKLPEANAENERALKLEPDFSEALLLRRIIQGKMAEGAAAPGAEGTATNPAGSDKPRFLKPADIAVLKVSEWQPDTDAQLRGTVDRKTLEAFWNEVLKKQGDAASSREAHDAFVNQTNFAEQVKQIKKAGDPKYMEKVVFSSDPAALLNFKKNIQPYVMQNCATAACHAGDKAGNFKLYRPANGANDQTLYTNFYILSMYANADGRMIDRDDAKSSLLLQYGMIKDKTAKPHPGKTEVRYFTDSNDPRFQPMLDWIKSLAFPTPHYGIIYELPGAAPTPAPTPTPTTAPAPKTPPTPKPK